MGNYRRRYFYPEAAEYCDLAVNTMKQYRSNGLLTEDGRFGLQPFFYQETLDKFLTEKDRPSPPPQDEDGHRLYTSEEAAAMLGITRAGLSYHKRTGHIRPVRTGPNMYRLTDIVRLKGGAKSSRPHIYDKGEK